MPIHLLWGDDEAARTRAVEALIAQHTDRAWQSINLSRLDGSDPAQASQALAEARTPAFVRWHQDSTYFYLQPHLHVTAWVALSEASVQAGCMQVLPGSHRWGAFEHDDKPEPMNMIRRGQGISNRFDQAQGQFMPVCAGQMSLHHTDLVHASGGNDSDDRRIGYAISYIPAHVRPVGAVRPSALCVRGRSHGHFVEEHRLREPLSSQAQDSHTRALALFRSLQDTGFQVPVQETA